MIIRALLGIFIFWIAFMIGFFFGERSEYRRVKKILEGSSEREN